MLKFDIITIFPEIFDSYFKESLIKRALDKRLIKINIHNLRKWTKDRHKTVDDRPYGGGAGMVLKIEPIQKAVQSLISNSKFLISKPRIAEPSSLRDRQIPNPKSKSQNTQFDRLLHRTIKKVTEDLENFRFNTAISAMMILLNQLESEKAQVGKSEFEIFLKLLAPFAPHMTEEIWHKFGHTKSIHLEEWPKYDESKIKEENANIVVQINGKIRAQFEAPVGISESDAKEKAETMPEVQKWLENKEIKKVIFVPNKIINFVLKQTVGIDKLIS